MQRTSEIADYGLPDQHTDCRGVRMTPIRRAVFFIMATTCVPVAFAADVYPVRPVRVIASFGPGSTVDLVARIMSQQLAEQMGKPFIVDNRPGAAGTIGYATVAK